jgi:hypothetical protein
MLAQQAATKVVVVAAVLVLLAALVPLTLVAMVVLVFLHPSMEPRPQELAAAVVGVEALVRLAALVALVVVVLAVLAESQPLEQQTQVVAVAAAVMRPQAVQQAALASSSFAMSLALLVLQPLLPLAARSRTSALVVPTTRFTPSLPVVHLIFSAESGKLNTSLLLAARAQILVRLAVAALEDTGLLFREKFLAAAAGRSCL